MRMTCDDARKCLRDLAAEAARLDGGRAANRLAAYALLLGERPGQREQMHAQLQTMAVTTPNQLLAGVLREACCVVRNADPGGLERS